MFATWIWAVCANLCGRCELSSCAFKYLSKQLPIIRANVWRLIDALTEANYSFQQGVWYSLTSCYSLHNVRQSQALTWVILSQIIQLIQVNETSHDSTEWGCRAPTTGGRGATFMKRRNSEWSFTNEPEVRFWLRLDLLYVPVWPGLSQLKRLSRLAKCSGISLQWNFQN